jgi:uncharacterized membrane protein
MNKKIFGSGAVLLIIGIAFFIIGYLAVQNVMSYNVLNLPIHELLMLLDPEIRSYYEIGNALYYIGILLGIVGLALFIAGASLPDKECKRDEKPKTDDDALKILKLRYVKGEITEDEYEKMRKDIEG